MALEHQERRARRLAERRAELNLTQEEVAERMQDAWAKLYPDQKPDRTRGQMVSDWERAENDPSPAKLELLATALETTVADLSAGPKSERRRKPEKAPDPFAQGGEGTLSEIRDLIDSLTTTVLGLQDEQRELANAVRRLSGEGPDEQTHP